MSYIIKRRDTWGNQYLGRRTERPAPDDPVTESYGPWRKTQKEALRFERKEDASAQRDECLRWNDAAYVVRIVPRSS